jgi:hypothetical protein
LGIAEGSRGVTERVVGAIVIAVITLIIIIAIIVILVQAIAPIVIGVFIIALIHGKLKVK